MLKFKKAIIPCVIAGLMILGGCGTAAQTATTAQETIASGNITETVTRAEETTAAQTATAEAASAEAEESEWFSNRDLAGTYDESEAQEITLNGESVTITEEGVYILSGTISDGQIIVEVEDTEKVQLVLDGVTISSSDSAAIYVKSADKVFITLAAGSTNTLSTTDEFASSEDNVDAVIFSKDDLTINGTGTLNVSTEYGHAIVGKDDLTITGGTIVVESSSAAITANDVLAIVNADITITSDKDGIKADNDDTTLGIVYIESGTFTIVSGGDAISATGELIIEGGDFDITSGGGSSNGADHQSIMNMFGGMRGGQEYSLDDVDSDDDDSVSSMKGIKADGNITIDGGSFVIDSADDAIHTNSDIVINDGTFEITTGDDGIHADGMVTINGGTFNISAWEGIEGTYILINDGTINIEGDDDGINATNKSSAYESAIEINGGYITVNMASGDTDGIDSNGNIYVNGGTIDVTGQSTFDYDGYAEYNGGTIIVNGQQTDSIPNQQMGGGGMMGGGPGGR